MASESNSSLLIPPITQESTQSQGTRGTSAQSTWIHGRKGRMTHGEDPKQYYCLRCEQESRPKIYYTPVTTNFRNHLKSEHSVIVRRELSPLQGSIVDQLQQLYLQAESTDQTSEIDILALQKHLNRDVIYEALISLIVVRSLPFRLVEWPEFHALCQVLNPESKGFITTAHSQVAKKLEEAWLSHKDIVRRKLQAAISRIHLSLDIWTSPQGYLLLGVVAHFIEQQDENHVKALIALKEVAGHSGEDQFAALRPVLEDYGIVRQLGAVVGDNAGTNDTLCREIEHYMDIEEEMQWEAEHWRIRCSGHIINLAIQAFLFYNIFGIEELESHEDREKKGQLKPDEVEQKRAKFRLLGPLGQLHNIVVHSRGSPARKKLLETLAGRQIPLDNRTRWNSWYLMVEVALELHIAIDAYCKEHYSDLEKDYLKPKDWQKLRTIYDFLRPFYRATLDTQGDAATIDRVLLTMDILIEVFKNGIVSNFSLKIG